MPRFLIALPLFAAGCLPLITQPWSEIEAGLEDSDVDPDVEDTEDTEDTEHPIGDFESYTVSVIFGWDHDSGAFHDVTIGGTDYPPIGLVTFIQDDLECTVVFNFDPPTYLYWTVEGGYQDGVWSEAADIDSGTSASNPDDCDQDQILELFDGLQIQGATIGAPSAEMSDVITENFAEDADIVTGGGIVYGSDTPALDQAVGIPYTDWSTDSDYQLSAEMYDEDLFLKSGAYEIFTPFPIPL